MRPVEDAPRTLETTGFKKMDENRQLFLIIRQISRVVVVVAASVCNHDNNKQQQKNVVFSFTLLLCSSSTVKRRTIRVYVSVNQFSLFFFFLTDMGSTKFDLVLLFVVVCMPIVRFLHPRNDNIRNGPLWT